MRPQPSESWAKKAATSLQAWTLTIDRLAGRLARMALAGCNRVATQFIGVGWKVKSVVVTLF
jgi:hypothetical protein